MTRSDPRSDPGSDPGSDPLGWLYRRLTGGGARRAATDPDGASLSESTTRAQPANFMRHVGALASTKTGDGLLDPKLVLSWLLASAGASAAAIGALVPVREAGALLPQLLLAPRVQRSPRTRRWWALGATGQGAFVLAIAAASLMLEGPRLGWTVLALLGGFALSRAVCSVTYKRLAGASLVRSTRGTAAGVAGTVASLATFSFGGLLATGVIPLEPFAITTALAVAGLLWWLAAATLIGVQEDPVDSTSDSDAGKELPWQQAFDVLGQSPQLRRFVLVRSLLVATALAPPFLVTSGSDALGSLGPFVVASAAAAALSSYAWGRLADTSSRRVLIHCGWIAALPLGAMAALDALGAEGLDSRWLRPGMLFLLMLAYHGVRLGRSTHLIDMCDASDRPTYTAVANSVIGLVLLVGAAFGALADLVGRSAVLALFAGCCLLASWLGRGLDEVQGAS